jgi:cyanophycinase
VLVVPQAALDADVAAAYLVDWFLAHGAGEVMRLDRGQTDAIERADLIWITSGQQERLLDALADPATREALRARHASGCVVGGTSAGAAVVGEVAILHDPVADDGRVPIAPGLGLWPGVVIDQHYTARGRQGRLRQAVQQVPGCLGLGIDEGLTLVAAPGTDPLLSGDPCGSVFVVRAGDGAAGLSS